MLNKLLNVYKDLVLQIKTNQYDFLRFDLIKQDEIKALATEIASKYQTIVIIGFGASCLNVRALLSIKAFTAKKLIYLNSLDQLAIDQKLASVDLNNSVFFSLSKSGNTNETYLLTKYALEILRVPVQNIYVIVPFSNNLLYNLANSFGANCLEHDNIKSGRFGIISNASLIPATIAGINIHKVVLTALQKLSDISADGYNICKTAEYYLKQYSLNRHMFVMFNYCYQLDSLYRWQQQIIAESLGKNGFGITPIMAEGTFDQHSQLQLYLEGPDDKFYKVITNNKVNSNMAISIATHANNIYKALMQTNRPVILENFEHIDEQIVIDQIIKIMFTVILIANYLNIDPFNQPSVDNYKKLQ